MKHQKQALALSLGLVCAGSLCLTGCGKSESGNSSSSGEDVHFSWWMTAAESTDYYTDYTENPVLKYITDTMTFENAEGGQSTISFEVQAPPSGKEEDNFNTLLSTDSYTDIMDLTFYSGSAAELYEEGKILDLTEYIDKYMPNYKGYLEAHPEVAKYATIKVGDEEKYLTLTSASDSIDAYSQDFGFCYRRDWILKYGKQPDTLYDPMKDDAPTENPNAGEAFTGYFTLDNEGNEIHEETYSDTVNGDSWVDDIVFPSGNPDPTYISDWEWMFEIFETALEEEGITDGYALSIYYPGYNANGDLVCAFGGGGPTWYNAGDEIKFGAVTDDFKAYLECMNQWYENGWLDKQFAERSADMFYRIDEVSYRSGKVGLWMGAPSTLGTRLYAAEQTYTDGIMVFAAPQPINDIYGGEEQQLQIPYTMYQAELSGGAVVVSDKAKDKDLQVLFEFLDYLYSEEGSILRTMGLSKEQMEACQNETYKKLGLDEGGYTVETIDGETYYRYAALLEEDDGNVKSAMTGNRLPGLRCSSKIVYSDTETMQHNRELWVCYEATGFLGGQINGRRTAERMKEHGKIRSRIENEYMYINVPKFIKGEKNLEEDWETFCKDLAKRDYQSVCDGYNEALE
ncbi:MAG: hypothetical protein Q4F41_10680 [Eubacteriales bacterium]|nr:hypothetical protein [Eubacteriales bacterium]